jgi:hypothetical protein
MIGVLADSVGRMLIECLLGGMQCQYMMGKGQGSRTEEVGVITSSVSERVGDGGGVSVDCDLYSVWPFSMLSF